MLDLVQESLTSRKSKHVKNIRRNHSNESINEILYDDYKENNANIYMTVSPKIFRKNVFQKAKKLLQKEIICDNKKHGFKTVDFDPAFVKKTEMDIPNLYHRKKANSKKVNVICVR